MRREDIMVEVRDRNLQRVGQVTTKYLKLSATIRHNATGDWKLTLPGAHPMVPYLSAAGAGIVVSYRANPAFSNVWSTLFSGPTSLPSRKRNREQPDGTFVFEGRTDGQLLDDARAFPDPATADPSWQNEANDTRTAIAESLMRAYVRDNIGPTAPAERKTGSLREFIATTQANLGRGPMVTKSPRFQILSELLSEIGTYANLGYQLVQRNDLLEFEVLTLTDRSAFVRFDIANGSLTSEEVQVTPPAVTRAIVAGQGEGIGRTIVERRTAASSAAELDWGRIIERFIDQRDTNDLVELQQSGDEALIEEGFVATNVKVVPADDTTMLFARDWNVGEIVTVVVNGQETKTTVTEAVLLVDNERCVIGAAIGDVRGFNAQDALTKRVEDTERRVERMERTVEVKTEFFPTDITGLIDELKRLVPIGEIKPMITTDVPNGWLTCDGSVQLRNSYPSLFAALNKSVGAATVTLASPGVWTRTAHGLANGARVFLTTTGALPTGLAQNTTYYVVNATANTFQLALTQGAVGINTSGAQSGVHTIWRTYAGVTSATQFSVPDLRGRTLVGWDTTQEEFNALGEIGGSKTETLTVAQMPSHTHIQDAHSHGQYVTAGVGGDGAVIRRDYASDGGGSRFDQGAQTAQAIPTNQYTGGNAAHNNMQPYAVANYIIRAL